MVQVVAHLLVEAAVTAASGSTVEVSTACPGATVEVLFRYPGERPAVGPFAAVVSADLDAEGGRLTYTTVGGGTRAALALPVRK
jgi:hypothetical protein